MRLPRRWYGAGPPHLVLMAASFALAGYAGVRLLDAGGDTTLVVLWFVGAALVHDLVLLPLYTLADRALAGPPGRRNELVNFVRVPALLSGLLLLLWWPLITRRATRYEPASGMSPDRFLGNWLLITAVLFVLSALWLAARTARSRRRATKARPPDSH